MVRSMKTMTSGATATSSWTMSRHAQNSIPRCMPPATSNAPIPAKSTLRPAKSTNAVTACSRTANCATAQSSTRFSTTATRSIRVTQQPKANSNAHPIVSPIQASACLHAATARSTWANTAMASNSSRSWIHATNGSKDLPEPSIATRTARSITPIAPPKRRHTAVTAKSTSHRKNVTAAHSPAATTPVSCTARCTAAACSDATATAPSTPTTALKPRPSNAATTNSTKTRNATAVQHQNLQGIQRYLLQ